MKKVLCIMFIVAFVYAMPAYAGKYLTLTTEADCNGLTIKGTICGVYSHHPGNLLVYTINVNGEIITGEIWEKIDFDGWACLPVSFYIPLNVEMCGDVHISGIIEYYGSYEEFDRGDICETYEFETFVSDCPCYSFCPRTPGYWKNHPKAWPVDSIAIGGKTLTKKQAMFILWCPVKSRKNIILMKHLIAAILNVASGSDPSINDVIDQANECLASCFCDKDYKEELKNMLDVYNNGEDCH